MTSFPQYHNRSLLAGSLLGRVACLGALAAFVQLGCSSANELGDDDVAQVESPIQNATSYAAEYSGDVVLQVLNPDTQQYYTVCSAVLMMNGVALTAKHCKADMNTVTWGKYARMGSQIVPITGWVSNPTWDVAVVRFTAMRMYNYDGSTKSGGTDTTTSGYKRVLYSGSNQSFNNSPHLMICRGYGPGGYTQHAPQAVLLSVSYNTDPFAPQGQPHIDNSNQNIVVGDSGAGCYFLDSSVIGKASYKQPVAYIQEGVMGSFAYGTGAESFRSWFGY